MKMKKWLSVLLTLCFLMSLLPVTLGEVSGQTADIREDTSTVSGIDVVVALDMTSSMNDYTNQKGNDPFGYRIDATAMLIGMMDGDGSRVAIVPFGDTPLDPIDFTDLSDSEKRRDLISDIYDNVSKKSRPSTNIGAALMKAEEMLLSRDNQTNRPMIVLLTDGENAIINGSVTVKPSIRWKNGQIEIKQAGEAYNTKLADKVTYEAYECAKTNNIPIYAVALGTDPQKANTSGISLDSISSTTSGMGAKKTERDNAKELPTYFAKILANQIGSSVERMAKPVEVEKNTYEVKIPILNKKVLETNIILPINSGYNNGSLSSIDASTITLEDNTGVNKTNSDEITTLRGYKNSHFAMIKIREPETTGMWTLRFKSEKDPSQAIFNILYKYNIKLNADVQTLSGSREFHKTDKLSVKAWFADNTGNPADDSDLYVDHAGEDNYEDWMTIRSTWSLYRTNSEGRPMNVDAPLKEGKLNTNTVQNRFETEIDLTEGGKLPSGNYLLMVKAAGAGLDRTVEIPLQLKNHPPVARVESKAVDVNSVEPGQENSWTVENTSGKFDNTVRDIVVDPDNDDLQFNLEPVGDSQSVALMSLNPNTGEISYRTIPEQMDDGSAKVRGGTATYKLLYNDGDDEGSGSVDIILTINSIVDAMLQKYELEVKIEGEEANGPDTYLKNKPVTIYARLKNKDNHSYAASDILQSLKREISIIDQTKGEPLVSNQNLELNDSGDALVFSVPSTGNKEAEWNIIVTVRPYETFRKTISIPNDHEPEPAEADAVTINCDGEKVPGFMASVIGENTPEEDLTRIVSIQGLFTDTDGDELSYQDPFFVNPATGEATDEKTIWAVKDGQGENASYTVYVSGETTSLFNYTMASEMHLRATDGDGRCADYVRTYTIVDLYNKLMTYLLMIFIAIVVLVILYLIIHQIRKPVFPKLNMTIREEPSLYDSGSEPLSPVKTYTNLNALGVDGDMAGKHGISMELLQSIIVKPIRSRTSVGVICKKAAPGHEVMLEEVRMKQKKEYVWKIGQELTVRSENGDGLVAVKLEESSGNEEILTEEFQTDEWTEVNNSTVSYGGKKHSRKAERKAPPAEETQDFGSTDNFDF